jgi:hypothetical protein
MTYLDYDLLELNQDRIGPIQEFVEQDFTLLDYETGARAVVQAWAAPAPVRPFTWTAIGALEITAMRAFLDARKGRAVPFWLPSYQWDLTLGLAIDALDTTITIAWARYQDQLFGTTGARRHVGLWTAGIGAIDCYEITAAACAGEREPEVLSIDPAAVKTYALDSTVISFLKLCRLERDQVTISYPAKEIARATISVRELPMESPL